MFLFKKVNLSENLRYYLAQNYEQQNSFKLLLKLLFSFGLYGIKWIYFHNKFFTTLDDRAPEPLRGAFILLIIPVLIYVIELLLLLLFTQKLATLVRYNFYLIWAIFIFLSLKYLYDFCLSFARVTNTNVLIWYILLYIGYFPVVFLALNIYLPLWTYLIPILAVTLMQALLNRIVEEELLFEEKNRFNQKPRNS